MQRFLVMLELVALSGLAAAQRELGAVRTIAVGAACHELPSTVWSALAAGQMLDVYEWKHA